MRAKILIAVLAVVALLGAGVALFVNAPSGQRFLTDRIARAIGGAEQTVTIKEIGGDWPSHIIWTGITVSDRQGPWLTLDRLELRLRPGALLRASVEIDSAVAGAAHMLRLPASAPQTQPSPPPTIDGIARALNNITVHDARVGVILLDPPVMGRAIDATLTGSLRDDPDSRLHTLVLDARLRNEPGSLGLKFAAGREAAVLQVNGTAETLTAAGAIAVNNRSNALSGALKLNCAGTPHCFAWSGGQVGIVEADLVVAGTLTSPQGTLDFNAQDLALGARKLPRLQGQIVARPAENAPGGTTVVTGTGTGAGLPGALPEGQPLIGDEARWSFALTRAPDGALTLDTARLESGDVTAEVAALGLTPKLSPATVRLTVNGAGRMLGLADSVSRTDLTLRLDRLEEGGVGAGHLTLATTGLPASAGMRPLLQESLTLDAEISATPARIKVTNILGRSGDAAVRGSSAWLRAPRFDHATSALTVTVPPVGTLLPEPTQADITLSGPLATLHADVSATAPAVLLSRAPVHDAVLSASLDRTPGGFTAKIDGNARWIDGPLVFSAGVTQVAPGAIEISEISWDSGTVNLSGALNVNTQTNIITGELRGPITDLAPLTTAFGAPSAGTADLGAQFSANDGQRLRLTLTGRDIRGAALEAGALAFTGTFDDLWGEMKIATRAEATDATLFDRPLAGLTTRADGTLKALKIEVNAKGAADVPFALASVTDITFGDVMAITFQRLDFRDGALEAKLLAPAQLAISAESMSLGPTRIGVHGGEAEAAFTWNKVTSAFDGTVRAQNLAVPAFTDIPGQSTSVVVSGDLVLSGPITAVNASGQLSGNLPGAKGQAPINLTATIAMANGRAKIDATARGLSAEPARLVADIPMRLNLSAARFALITTEPVSGSLKWTGSLAPLWRLVPADVNVLAGDVVIDAALAGTLDNPIVSGTFNLAGGTYENLVGGTALRNIEARIGGDGQGGFTLSLKAQDMNDGSVTLSGRIAGDDRLTSDVTADLVRLDILQRDDVVAAATGKVSYTGPFAAGIFKGDVQLVRSLVRLGGSYMPEIPLLRALPGFEPVGNDSMLASIGVDIGMTTSDPMRVEGQGLDSLWRGQMNVTGSLARPDVRGTLTLDRGSFSFIGQTFTLDSGTVTFTGGGTIDPQLNIVAVREASDITATVNIRGNARSPDVQLSSRPALPRDEILARLLFRKGTGELGPIESIQLASAASDLAGISQGGINGVLRRTLGIDVSSGSEGNSVMVGRQLGRNVYVSVGQSLTEQEREIIVEWRISRSFSVKSTTSDVTGADIGLFWRKDY